MTTRKCWIPPTTLQHYFTPTRLDKAGEIRKAEYKNLNVPFLQHMYHGDPKIALRCCITGQIGWNISIPCFCTGVDKSRFNIDFNHIRQEMHPSARAGDSKDKSLYDPSHWFRSKRLSEDALVALEFASIIPVTQEIHCYITQDSAKGNLTLSNFKKEWWPWVLQSQENYESFFDCYKLIVPPYDWFIDHLSDIEYDPLHNRLEYGDNFKTVLIK